MFELIAEGPLPGQRWRTGLRSGNVYTIGRSVTADLAVPWDPHVSRSHVRLALISNGAELTACESAANPVFIDGEPFRHCNVPPGGCFVIGSTTFQLEVAQATAPTPGNRTVEEVTFSRQDLQRVRFRDADKRIEVLTQLPEVIGGSRTESDLYHRLTNLVLAGVPRAEAVAIVRLTPDGSVHVCHWERRRETAGEFHASGRLITEAIQKRRSTVLHIWEASNLKDQDYTAIAEFDWAFCTPVLDSTTETWGLYVAGRLDRHRVQHSTLVSDGNQLQADVKFSELVAEIISSVQRVNKLERQQAGLRQFFAPPILSALGEEWDTELLEPRECDVTVMFCDLRGFSQQAEESAHDLIGLLDRVSRALGVMTLEILNHGGVTGDFQGDAALGFWGWPFPSEAAVLDACRAAIKIRLAFAKTFRKPAHPLADFQTGIGIAHGRAVAGKIGTTDQVKVTVFGPVVNLASRLESMTKILRVPILMDEPTAEMVRDRLDPAEGRVRKLAKVLPYGMETPVFVSELLPSEADFPELTNAHLEEYEQGVDHFVAGRWDDAYRCLHDIPASDRAQDFLAMLITQHNRIAPQDWDGIVRLSAK